MAVIQNHCAPIWLSTNPGWYPVVTRNDGNGNGNGNGNGTGNGNASVQYAMAVASFPGLVPRPPPAFFRIHEMGIRLGTRLQWQGLWTLDFTMGKKKNTRHCPRPVRLRYILVPRPLGTN